MIENKEVMAKNIRFYMELYGVNSTEMCKTLGFKQSTFSNWINAKIYPRIDKIEQLANYFNITKADLVEPHTRSIIRRANNYDITSYEVDIILAFRKAPDSIKESVLKLLDLSNLEKIPGVKKEA